MAFNNRELFDRLKFNPWAVVHRREYYRLLTHGFVHIGWEHLLINMLVLYSFGKAVIGQFVALWGSKSSLYFILLYVGGLLASNIIALRRHKDDAGYNAVGASGAVSSVLFAAIFFNPWNRVYFFGILPIPGIIFAVLYLLYSGYMSRRVHDAIAHDAHLLGAIFGFLFPILLDARLLPAFLRALLNL
jgi:membrane associated rhomboid family serine protease